MKLARISWSAIFAIAVVAFFLPFATVSCDEQHTKFTGIELVRGDIPPASKPAMPDDLSNGIEDWAGPSASLAFGAAIAALVFSLLGLHALRPFASGAGLLSSIWLGDTGGWGGEGVHIRFGFWLLLGTFAGAVALEVIGALWRTRLPGASGVRAPP